MHTGAGRVPFRTVIKVLIVKPCITVSRVAFEFAVIDRRVSKHAVISATHSLNPASPAHHEVSLKRASGDGEIAALITNAGTVTCFVVGKCRSLDVHGDMVTQEKASPNRGVPIRNDRVAHDHVRCVRRHGGGLAEDVQSGATCRSRLEEVRTRYSQVRSSSVERLFVAAVDEHSPTIKCLVSDQARAFQCQISIKHRKRATTARIGRSGTVLESGGVGHHGRVVRVDGATVRLRVTEENLRPFQVEVCAPPHSHRASVIGRVSVDQRETD
mmetsp:Transcript_105528/g.305055  ORF Transcript_105528/g.305055 Transcript_105528/m.305055 type:complete len:271 (-) Transcript_105528:320-1132(-)